MTTLIVHIDIPQNAARIRLAVEMFKGVESVISDSVHENWLKLSEKSLMNEWNGPEDDIWDKIELPKQ
jgi:hypothetical protein